MKHAFDSTRRFSDRVKDYLLYRPGYPTEFLKTLERDCGLQFASVVADIGSGTGLLCKPFLENRIRVIAVEPNNEMRAAAESALCHFDTFVSVNGTAEETGLQNASVDLITAGQAFHWFEPRLARREFQRILKKDGHVALVWNEREVDASQFQRGYERLLIDYCPDYLRTRHTNIDTGLLASFFGHDQVKTATFPNLQRFDYQGLKGRLLSSSYAPREGQPRNREMLSVLLDLFNTYQSEGTVVLEYATQMYHGPLTP